MLTNHPEITLGADPEFFFEEKGTIIGSEKVIKDHINVKATINYEKCPSFIIKDGVQGEFNVTWATCRAHLGYNVQRCFQELDRLSKKKQVKINLFPTTYIKQDVMLKLSEDSKKFGCSPSLNAWDNPPAIAIECLNPNTYRFRSAGGHIHIGSLYPEDVKFMKTHSKECIQLLDILLGNTCVLLDSGMQKIRRKTYGRSGEYRIQKHGLEYRTLSNFWLRSYQLMSMVAGIAREAIGLILDNLHKDFFDSVSKEDIINAINDNNKGLARENLLKLLPAIDKHVPNTEAFSLTTNTVGVILDMSRKRMKNIFNIDPIKHWTKLADGHGIGWESFAKYYREKKDITKLYK